MSNPEFQKTLKLVNIGIIGGMGLFLTHKLMYAREKPTGNKNSENTKKQYEYFSETEMKLYFMFVGMNAFAWWVFWDKFVIENNSGFWQKHSQTSLLLASIVYGACAISPSKLKYLVAIGSVFKLIGFVEWCKNDVNRNLDSAQNIALFKDGLTAFGYAMAFKQLYQSGQN